MTPSPRRRKVILVELNEITWRFVDPFCKAAKLPAFAELIQHGVRCAPRAPEVPPDLDPWISWTTLYTGRPQAEHGVRFLEQPPETVTGPRLWDIAADAGLTVGVYGSIMSWPPRNDVRGFWVPSTFSPGPETFPSALRPIQELNLGHTRAHTPVGAPAPKPGLFKRAWQLRRLGLRVATAARLASFLVRSRLRPHRAWEKVSLQPVVNLDFFEKLYRQHRPDFATFHSNHVAHYQHRYWRAADPAPFPVAPSAEERRRFGPAIEFGYRVSDRALRRLMHLAGPDTVVVVASGLGQQPYVVEQFREGRAIIRIRDIHQLVDLCGVTGDCVPVSMMAPQWNLKISDPAKRAQAERILAGAWVGDPGTKLFAFATVGDTINLNVHQKNLHPFDPEARCVFPEVDGKTLRLGDLCASQDATPKEGYHDPVGLAIFWGPGIRKGGDVKQCSTLDLAPTILHLLGLPVPDYMTGRILEEVFEGACRVAVPDGATGAVPRQVVSAVP
jgi:hypothetical protein